MYSEKFVASIQVNGQILRENNSTVAIPFGSEYSVYLKNLNTVRAVVHVSIDGKKVTGNGIILHPKEHIALERYLENLSSGNRFKFIERTAAVENHRGIGAEDGLIQVEYQFEAPKQPYGLQNGWSYPTVTYNSDGLSGQSDFSISWDSQSAPRPSFGTLTKSSAPTNVLRSMNASMGATATSNVSFARSAVTPPKSDVGITVKGSRSDQKFTMGDWFPTESVTHTVILKLVGAFKNGEKVAAPVTVKYKQECTSCGRVNKITDKFCSNCGTGLVTY